MATITRSEPRESERLRRAVAGADQGPTDEQRDLNSGVFRSLISQLDAQDPTNVSFPFLRRMRWHHGVAMGLHLIKTPHVKSSFFFECLAEGTQVLMADGTRRSIEDVREGDVVLSSGGESLGYDIVVHAGKTGHRELIKVKLDDGREISCTPDHKIFGWDSWIEAGDLKPGDTVCIAGERPDYPFVDEDLDDAWLVGLWLAEGSKCHSSYHVTCGTDGVRERLEEIAKRRGWFLRCRPKRPIEMTLSADRKDRKNHVDTPYNLLKNFGVRGMTTRTIAVPDRIMRSSNESVAAFLSGYLAGDGCVANTHLSAHSKSKCMMDDLRILSFRLGVKSRVCRVKQRGYDDAYVWHVGTFRGLAVLESILDITGKQDALTALVIRAFGGGVRKDRFAPPEYSRMLSNYRGPYNVVRKTKDKWTNFEHALRKAQDDGADDLVFKLTNGLEWGKVKSIEDDGHGDVYDVTTACNSAFFTEFGLVHNSDDARVSAFADNLVRPIYGSLMLTVLRELDYGYSPAVLNHQVVNPSWTYMADGEIKRVWDSDVVGAFVYKKPTGLKPESCRLSYDDNGVYNGILWDEYYAGKGAFMLAGKRVPQIDLQHSLWATHDEESEDSSPYGYPRIATCAPIFHMYRYIWTLLGRAFENNADPGPVVRFPEDDKPPGEDGESNLQTALRMGRRRRSGSTLALPSKPYSNYANDRTTSIPQWAIEYPKNETDFVSIQSFMGYLDAMTFRALLLSEGSVSDTVGGNSSKNVVGNLSSQRDTSQIVLMQQIMDNVIMKQIVAPAMAINMPWYEGRLEMKTLGFGQDDEDIVRQVFQLAGQQDLSQFGIDLRRLTDSKGFPMLSDPEFLKFLKDREAKAAQVADQIQQPPAVEPTQGRRALVTQTGFADEHGNAQMAYVQLHDPIDLSSSADGDFVAALPQIETWEDRVVLDAARALRSRSSDFLAWAYRDAAIYVSKREVTIDADLLADDRIRIAVDRLVQRWTPAQDKITKYTTAVRRALGKAYDRTATIHLRRLASKKRVSQLDQAAAQWLDERGAQLVSGVLQTTRDELASFMADLVREGKGRREIADEIRTHFASFPQSRAEAIARTEIGEAYNFSTVTTGIAAGVKKAQLIDGTRDNCGERNGKIVDITDALNERLNHTNCQLYIKLLPNVPEKLEIRRTRLDGEHLARYDEDAQVVLLSTEIKQEDESKYLIALATQRFS